VYTVAPTRREALISPPSLLRNGVGGIGFALAFPYDVKSQNEGEEEELITMDYGLMTND
jgi:hypothetical protein